MSGRDIYRIQGPALISFSGGRTSGYMLWHILDAHDGQMPDDVHVCFANTGKELPETLQFVRECETRWGVRVNWLEYRGHRGKALDFAQVDFDTASRKGEPFDLLVARKTALPNWQARWCTSYLKVLVMFAFMESRGLHTYAEIVGLRADEPWRVAKMVGRNADDGRNCMAPLSKSGVTKPHVMDFWSRQPFDLGLEPGEGNCDLCFMKGKRLRAHLMRKRPWTATWWIDKETGGRFFDRRSRYATLAAEVQASPDLFAPIDPDEEFDAECGLWCAGEAA